jgi:hypothetical protein
MKYCLGFVCDSLSRRLRLDVIVCRYNKQAEQADKRQDTLRYQHLCVHMEQLGIESGSKKDNRSSCDPLSSNSIIQGVSGSPISVVLPSSFTSSSSNGRATGSCLEDISRDPSLEFLVGVSMDELAVEDSKTSSFLYIDQSLPFRNRTESSYVGPEELPPSKVSCCVCF